MRKILSCLVLTGITLTPFAAQSQETSGCFMLGNSSQFVDLSQLCGDNSPQQSNPNSGMFRIPIKRRDGGTPVIDVTFNGKQRFEMLFDTGATGTVLTQQMAKALKIKQEGAVLVSTPSHNAVPFPTGRLASIAVAGAVSKDIVVVISPSLPIGLLGQDFFGRYDVTIKSNVIELHIRE